MSEYDYRTVKDFKKFLESIPDDAHIWAYEDTIFVACPSHDDVKEYYAFFSNDKDENGRWDDKEWSTE